MDYFIDIPEGRPPKLMGRKDRNTFSLQKDNPIDKVCMYKQEIFNLYCPRLDHKSGLAVITAGVIFPFADDNRVKELFSSYMNYKGLKKYPTYYPISGRNSLFSRNIKSIFPTSQYNIKSKEMSEEKYNDLKVWLIEPDAPIEQRERLNLSPEQTNFVTTRTKSGYRRIKGPAGSGKSLVLAARAAQLAHEKYEKKENKDVLILTYNITLINYLVDLSVRWPTPGAISRKDLTFLSFYEWCKRICFESGYIEQYDDIWRNHHNDQINDEEGSWTLINQEGDNIETPLRKLVELVGSILNSNIYKENITYYDAILVDEGQFFLPEWWQLLRKVCKNGGEMLLVADKTQDIYGNAKSWTDEVMEGAGFHGPWKEFKETYRLPPKLINYTNKFAEDFLPKETNDLPDRQLALDLYPCILRWVQTTKEESTNVCYREIKLLMEQNYDLSVSDITFLSSNINIGYKVVNCLKNIAKCVHTFDSDNKVSRRKKQWFFKGDTRIKATTIHSFVGWETRALVLYIGEFVNKSLIYSGMTRLKRHEKMSFLTVVCSVPELERFGRAWSNQ